MSESPSGSQTPRPLKRKRRVYQACEPCRIRKAKCDRGSDDDPRPPPCARCMRESIQSQCILSSKRTRRYTERFDGVRRQQTARDPVTVGQSNADDNSGAREEQPARHQNASTTPIPTSMPFANATVMVSTVSALTPEDSENRPASRSPHPSQILQNTSQRQVPTSLGVDQVLYPPRHPDRDPVLEKQNQLQPQHDLIEQQDSRPYFSESQRNLTESVIHTLVSKPNDALSLLFEAAGRQDPSALNSRRQSLDQNCGDIINPLAQSNDTSSGGDAGRPRSTHPTPHSINTVSTFSLPIPPAKTIKLWERYRFVRQGWLTAREAIQAVDLFFTNLSPLSPILLDYYSDHCNHGALISDEPMLCTTILTISSRYHILSEDGGMLRSDDIHRKFSLYWKRLFMRVMYAQETEANAKTRNLGTIESFLLMTEWHTRGLYFPPDEGGWDFEVADTGQGGEDGGPSINNEKRSTEEVEGAARRSDRMSWMLLGCALTLAHELGVSEQRLLNRDISSQLYNTQAERKHAEFLELRRSRPRRLLYIYINQLASRLGWSSMMPRIISDSAEQPFGSETEKQWHNVMSRWISLTRLTKTASDMLFSSVTTEQLLRSGKYVTSLEHFGQLLQDWHTDYLTVKAEKKFLDILFIEFQFTRTYINSLAVQAVAERAFKVGHPSSGPTEFLMTCVFESHSVDFGFIQEVVDGSRKIINKVLELSEEGILKFCPERIFSRIISASILLLKATGLGTRIEEARYSLELLDNLIRALRHDPVDELHLANRYASLLRTYVKAFRTRFLRAVRSRDNPSNEQRPGGNNFVSSVEQEQELENHSTFQRNATASDARETVVDGVDNFDGNDMTSWTDAMTFGNFGDDWMCLPLDAFDPGLMGLNNGLGARGLDFFRTA